MSTYFLCSPSGVRWIDSPQPYFKECVPCPSFSATINSSLPPDNVEFLERVYQAQLFRREGFVWPVLVESWMSEELVDYLIGQTCTAFACWLFRYRWSTLGPIALPAGKGKGE